MTNAFSSLARQYLTDFQRSVNDARNAGAVAVEMATRPVVHRFIEGLCRLTEPAPNQALVHHDLMVTPGNRPDWRIEDASTFGVFVYGDHKNLLESGSFQLSGSERSQMSRYLGLGRPVFVFDGIEFIFLNPKESDPFATAIRICLVPKPLNQNGDWASLPPNPQVEIEFSGLLKNPGFKKWSESDLINQLAQRARLLSEQFGELLEAPKGSGADQAEKLLIQELHELKEQLSKHHDPSLRDVRVCSDFVAQALIFGLFYAHTQAPPYGSSPMQRWDVIRRFWTDATHLKTSSRLRPFRSIAQKLESSLSQKNGLASWYRDAAAVLAHAEYVGTAAEPTDYHILFEKFLTAFNPASRFDYGAWYTPSVLTEWMVRFADALSERSFGAGLSASVSKVLDPCVGTGGFLEAFANFVDKDANQIDLVGFEILPAPYALANYRLGKSLAGTPLEPSLRLLLTDTLSDQVDEPPRIIVHEFDVEVAQACSLAKPPLQLIIGNPPSSITTSSGAQRKIIEALMDDFRPPRNKRSDRQNTQKAINNEAYRFLRWSAQRALSSERSILALILPGSFVHAVSLKYARQWLANRFDELWVLELDEDARNGSGTESLFKVLQGRVVLFGVRGAPRGGIRHLSIASQSLATKKTFLSSPIDLSAFESLGDEPDRFAPMTPYAKDVWCASWPLLDTSTEDGIFRLKCSGVKLGLTALVHVDPTQLIRRSKFLSSSPLRSFEDVRSQWFEGQRKPPKADKLPPSVRNAIGRSVSRSTPMIRPYSFRPFVRGHAIIDDSLFEELSKLNGDGARIRPEIQAAFEQGARAILVAHGPRDLGASLTRFVSFAWDLPDNDNVARGNSMVYCDKFPEKPAGSGAWDPAVKSNTNPGVQGLFDWSRDPDAEVVHYCYALLSCSTYLDFFEPVLFVSSDPSAPFRVPIFSDHETRRRIAELGEALAKCEDFSHEIPMSRRLATSWPKDLEEFNLISFQVDCDKQAVTLNGPGEERATIAGLSERACSQRISGHHVIEKWLRERTFPYLRRTFQRVDFTDLIDLIQRLENQLEIIDEIDAIVVGRISDPRSLVHPHLKVSPA